MANSKTQSAEAVVADIVLKTLGVEYKDPKETFEDLGADSLDKVEIIMGIEEECDLLINTEEGDKILCPQDAVDYIKAHRKVGA